VTIAQWIGAGLVLVSVIAAWGFRRLWSTLLDADDKDPMMRLRGSGVQYGDGSTTFTGETRIDS